MIYGDCLDVMRGMPDGSFDAIVTDPPYGIAVGSAFVCQGGSVVNDGSGSYNNTEDPYAWIREGARVLAPTGHVSTFIDRATRWECEQECKRRGLTPWASYYLVKSAPPPTPRPTFVSRVEECIVAEKRSGKRAWYGGGYTPNAWIGLTPNRLGEGLHPTQKPVEAMEALVCALAPEGGTVLDPFCGSGTTGVACVNTGRNFVGVEINEDYCAIARDRIGKSERGEATFRSEHAKDSPLFTGAEL